MSNVWYGSLQNRLAERTIQPEPEVGMGVTEMMWSDREPWEIIEVIDERHIVIRALDSKRIDNRGLSECQDYEYFSNENNRTARLFKTKKGQWRERIGRNGLGDTKFVIGYADKYWDPSF